MSKPTNRRWRISAPLAAVVAPIAYVLSSGPVLATAFWLREWTNCEGFYAALWLYYPVLWLGGHPGGPIDEYIGWWCRLLDVRGPG